MPKRSKVAHAPSERIVELPQEGKQTQSVCEIILYQIRFKVSAAASVGAFASQRCPPDTRTLLPQPDKRKGIPNGIPFLFLLFVQEGLEPADLPWG